MTRVEVTPAFSHTSVVQLDGVGPVVLERSRRARRLSLSVRPFAGARVAIPRRYSFAEAEQFARSYARWIARRLAQMRHVEHAHLAALRAAPPVDRAAARRQLLARLEALAGAHGFTYHGVTFRQQRTVWGSCSAKNRISVNLTLARLAPALIDYVLLHELVHTRIKNHSRAFWAELGRFVDDVQTLAAALKRHPLHVLSVTQRRED